MDRGIPGHISLPSAAAGSSPRLYYLDWLRVLAMIGIFFFHNARFYDVFGEWHVRNQTTDLGASILVAFLSQWIMPLFFLIAGAGTYYSLKSRRAGRFVYERSLRLFIPLIIGMFIIVAPQSYFDAVSHGARFEGYSFFQIYGLYLKTLPELNWFHLWFLAYLFVFSLVTIPIFINGAKSGRSAVSRLVKAFDRPWSPFLFLVLSLAAVDIFLSPDGFWGNRSQGNWSIIAYLLFFISGYMIIANKYMMEAVKKLSWVLLGIAVVALACLASFFYDVLVDLQANFGSGMFAAAQVTQAIVACSWLLAILGLGSRYLNSNNKALTYANEAVLPFYILHQTVIIVIGFYVVQWDTGVGLKYLTTSTTSFVAIMLIYELLVRRVNILRFLFGMRLRRST